MQIKNINKTIFENGGTSDIIKVVMMAYDIENDPQIEVLARKLQGKNNTATARNIWQYLIDNINYRADVGKQEIKSPARLINDRAGDCKSYSLFTAVVLRWLNIPCVFRFVSYGKTQEATHVYVVMSPSQGDERSGGVSSNIIIDAVASVQAGTPFNQELKYTYRCDMADKGTRIAYLAGLPAYIKKVSKANKYIGTMLPEHSAERYKVWIGDETEKSITPGKHYLYARFDLMLEMLNIAGTSKQEAYYFDQLDIIAALLYSYNYCNGVCKEIKRMAYIIAGMVYDGDFHSLETNEDVRADRFNKLLDILKYRYEADIRPTKWYTDVFDMFMTEVYPYNVIQSSIGSSIDSFQLAGEIKKAGIYHIYQFIPDSEINSHPAIVADKRAKQTDTFNWLASMNTYQTSSAMQLSIRSGIVARTGMTPEQYIALLKNGKQPDVAIGDPFTIVAACVSIILGLINIFKALFPPKAAQPSDSAIKAGAFDPTKDYSKSGTQPGIISASSGILLPLAIGGTILFNLFKKKA